MRKKHYPAVSKSTCAPFYTKTSAFWYPAVSEQRSLHHAQGFPAVSGGLWRQKTRHDRAASGGIRAGEFASPWPSAISLFALAKSGSWVAAVCHGVLLLAVGELLALAASGECAGAAMKKEHAGRLTLSCSFARLQPRAVALVWLHLASLSGCQWLLQPLRFHRRMAVLRADFYMKLRIK